MNEKTMNREVDALIQKFQNDLNYYKNTSYSEAQVRLDFIDPLFNLLGWDINNSSGKSASEREVIVEETLRDESSAHGKRPDYTFRSFSERKFFVEAKKPSVDIVNGVDEAKQIRRYGFTAKLPVSVLTNFEYLVIYDCSMPVEEGDGSNHSAIIRYHYTEYADKFEEISLMLGKYSVYNGDFDNEWEKIEEKIQKLNVNTLFLEQINRWRINLAQSFISIKGEIPEDEINDLVQSYLNSIIFLRVCEDRGLERPYSLLNIANELSHKNLISKLKFSDKKYNSGVFSLLYIEELIDDDNFYFWTIIKDLYYPESPFSFSVLPSNILGEIYEIFLGSKLKIKDGIIEIVEKNINRDVVTTPTFIIKEILKETVSKHCKNLDVDKILESKFADISCGSGAFLLEIFQLLQDKIVEIYLALDDKTQIQEISKDTYKLNFETKKKILVSCIFGVDKDYNATKAAEFGLLLKLLENENEHTTDNPILPDLSENIIFGNSLIETKDIEHLDSSEVLDEINAYDFGDLKFDVIVGNPPYLTTEHMKHSILETEIEIYKTKYKTSYKQFDKYYLFIEKAIELLKDYGRLGYIVPSKFTRVDSGKNLRELLVKDRFLKSMIYFGQNQIFNDKTTYTALIFGRKNSKNYDNCFFFSEVIDFKRWKLQKNKSVEISADFIERLEEKNWILSAEQNNIIHRLYMRSLPLEVILGKGMITNGIQTSAKPYIQIPLKDDGEFVFFKYKGKNYKVEKEVTRPYYSTSKHSLFHTHKDVAPNSFVIYPYQKVEDKTLLIGLQEIQEKYPNLYIYLQDIKYILNHPKRSIQPTPKTQNEWHRYGRHHSLEIGNIKQKIIVGILSNGQKYPIDNNRTFISSGGTAGYCSIQVPDNIQYSIFYIQALLNSKYLEYFAFANGEIFQGGYISRGTKVLKNMRIVKIDFDNQISKKLHDDIASIQEEINKTYGLILEASKKPRDEIRLNRKLQKDTLHLKELLKILFNFGNNDNDIPEVKEIYSHVDNILK
nr:type IIS restriction enzyme Eco57I, adenine methyltransferase [Psychrobacter sp.]